MNVVRRLWPGRARFQAPGRREHWLAVGPVALLAVSCAAKLLYIGTIGGPAVDDEWYPFTMRRAVQSGVANLGPLLIAFAPLWLLRPLARASAAWAVNLLLTLLVLANAVHLRFFGDVIPTSALVHSWQIAAVSQSVVHLLAPSDALLFVDLAAAALLFPKYRRALRATAAVQPRMRALAARSLIAGAALTVLVPLPLVLLDRGDIFRQSHVRFAGTRRIGLLNYHLYDGARFLAREVVAPRAVTAAERSEALAYLHAWRDTATAPSALFGVARDRNVILLMVESLQAFPIGLVLEGQEVTPNLNRLAASGMYFENVYDTTWEGVTSDGEFTSLQSLHPLPTGSVATTYPTHRFRGLPAILAARGYGTLSAHAFYGAFWNRQLMHRQLGFRESYFREFFGPGEKIGMGLGDREFLRRALPLLARQPEPFLAYLITLSSHHPYPLPAAHKALRLGDLEGTLVGDYLHSVHYADGAIGEFVRGLETRGLLDRSVLVLYGDHKAKLGEEHLQRLPGVGAGVVSSPTAKLRAWRERHRIPLLIRLPGGAHAGTYSPSGSQLDILPTVLGLLGVRDSGTVTLGRDLSGGTNSFVAFRNGSFALGDTLCVTPTASDVHALCGDVGSGETLDAARLRPQFQRARQRLRVSDQLVVGDLIVTSPGSEGRIGQRGSHR